MQLATSDILFTNDSRNTFLSLQLLDQINNDTTPAYQSDQYEKYETLQDYLNNYDKSFISKQKYSQQEKYSVQQCFKKETVSQVNQIQNQNTKSDYFNQEKQKQVVNTVLQLENPLKNIRKTESLKQQFDLDIFNNIEQSHVSKQYSKQQEEAKPSCSSSISQEQLSILKQLRQQAIANLESMEHTEQAKENFEILFKKVYGIIEQIEQRNQKMEMNKSKLNSIKKQLTINTRVIQLNVGKQNLGFHTKKVFNTQTDIDFQTEPYNEEINSIKFMKTEQWGQRTPSSSTSRVKQNNLLLLSKQYPSIGTPKATLSSARSDQSLKSKGITLVTLQKQRQKQVKKSPKITLVQKKIVMCPKKQINEKTKSFAQQKEQKKSAGFNPSNFFSSRRITTKFA